MTHILSQIFQGIAAGSIYGFFGLAMMFVYRTTRTFNFAQGEMATATAFIAWLLMKHMHPAYAVPLALVFGFLLGVFFEMGFLKLLRHRTESNSIIMSIGILSIINSIVVWNFGQTPFAFPTPIPSGGTNLAGVFLSYQDIWILFCTLFLSSGLYLFFRYTTIGSAFQALAEDKMSASLKGVRVNSLITLAWGIAAVFGGIAAMLMAPNLLLHPDLMGTVLFYSFASAAIGGLQSSFGAIVAGVMIGITENLVGLSEYVGSDMKTSFICALIVVFLAVKPRGLFGRDEPRKI